MLYEVITGQVAAMVCKIESCEEIIQDLMAGLETEINQLKTLF